ncbi:MAG TPA: 3-octaprenyl-4-hydroxybenzoate carboxy-lyase [Deltaproteobacteria bacterium]|nr:3-octaprenyl-4-hydroxybenzoate carboxy-lyase [Deltaproteobacteria bacterium]
MKRLIIGISGATGSIYGIRMLEVLKENEIETHLILTKAAKKTILLETEYEIKYVESLANYVYDVDNIGGAVASGSFNTEGMVVIPCSVKSLSAIANSYNDNLLIRAADVTLKEWRKLVLVVRETPLHKGHLQLMLRAADMGAVILPPVPAFYHVPKTIEGIIDHTVGKVLDIFGIEHHLFRKWDRESGDKAMGLLIQEKSEKTDK